MSESDLLIHLARELVDKTPRDDLHTVTVGEEPHIGEIVFGHVEGDAFVFVQMADFEQAWQGSAREMEARFKEEAQFFTDETEDGDLAPATYSAGDSPAIDFDRLGIIQIEQ
jgi:hypothetical protein